MTPAQAHKQRILAQHAAESGEDVQAAEPYRRLAAALADDRRVLEQIKSFADKTQAKKGMVQKYLPWLEDVAKSGRPQAYDPVFSTAVLWLIDIGELDTAVPYALFAIRHEMTFRDDYRRDLPDLLIEEIAVQFGSGAVLSAANHTALLDLIGNADPETGMHTLNLSDIVRAKFYKASGEAAEADDDLPAAAAFYESALKYSEKIGVKSRLSAIRKQLQG
ncbi:TPA: phage terminase small subunit [Neisseria lactamica]